MDAFRLSWEYKFEPDTRTQGWYFVDSPMPMMVILSIYLLFVKYIGPAWMQRRQAFELRSLMLIYNGIQILNCLWFSYEIGRQPLYELWRCIRLRTGDERRDNLHANLGVWWLFNKYMDLGSSLFFVLRKKQGQVTFLHLFHHVSMLLFTWFFVKYLPAGPQSAAPFLNSLTHILVYSYYFAMVYFRKVHVYWKMKVTQVQLLQFVVLFIFFTTTFINPYCDYPKWPIVAIMLHAASFIYIFGDFYYSTYLHPKWRIPQKQDID